MASASVLLRDPEFIFDKIKDGFKNWQVFSDISRQNRIGEHLDDDASVAASIDALQSLISMFQGKVTVVLYDPEYLAEKIRKGGNMRTHAFRIDLDDANQDAKKTETIGNTIQSMNFEVLDRIMSEREARHKSEIDMMRQRMEFEKRLDRIEAEKNEDRNPMLESLISGLMPLLTGQGAMPATNINGIATPEVVDSVTEINQLLNEWSALEPNFLDHLKAVVKVCKNKPELYRMALSSIQSL
jgi:hypothetical protein